MAARARRSADIVASVPELTSRTISTAGSAPAMRSASSTSGRVGAPNAVPRPSASWIAASTAGCR